MIREDPVNNVSTSAGTCPAINWPVASGPAAWAVETRFGGQQAKLPGQDSNLEKQDQNLL